VSKALALTERQARALMRAAEKEKGVAEVKIGTTVIRLIPASLAQEGLKVDDKGEGYF